MRALKSGNSRGRFPLATNWQYRRDFDGLRAWRWSRYRGSFKLPTLPNSEGHGRHKAAWALPGYAYIDTRICHGLLRPGCEIVRVVLLRPGPWHDEIGEARTNARLPRIRTKNRTFFGLWVAQALRLQRCLAAPILITYMEYDRGREVVVTTSARSVLMLLSQLSG